MFDPQTVAQQTQEISNLLKTLDKQTLWMIFIGGGGVGYLLLKLTLNFLLKWKGKKTDDNGHQKTPVLACYKQEAVTLAIDRNRRIEEDTKEIKAIQAQLANTSSSIAETLKAQQSTFAEVVSLTKIFLDIKKNGH